MMQKPTLQDPLDVLKLVIFQSGIHSWPVTLQVSKAYNRATRSVVDQWFNSLQLPQHILDAVVDLQSVKMRLFRFASRRHVSDRERWANDIFTITHNPMLALFMQAHLFFPFHPEVEEKFFTCVQSNSHEPPMNNSVLMNQAGRYGNVALVRWLMTRSVPMQKDFMHYLCQSGSLVAMEALYPDYLKQFPELKFDKGLLNLALSKGRMNVVLFILAKQPELQLDLSLREAAGSGNLLLVKKLVEEWQIPIDDSVLSEAIFSENLSLVEYLFNHRAKFNPGQFERRKKQLKLEGDYKSICQLVTTPRLLTPEMLMAEIEEREFNPGSSSSHSEKVDERMLSTELLDSIADIPTTLALLARLTRSHKVQVKHHLKKFLQHRDQMQAREFLFKYAGLFFPFSSPVDEAFEQHVESVLPSERVILYNDAGYYGNIALVRWLMQHKIPVSENLTECLCFSGDVRVVHQLEQEFPRILQFDQNALSNALSSGSIDLVKYILLKQPGLTAALSVKSAAKSGCLGLVRFLIESLKIKVDSQALNESVLTGNIELVRYLIDVGVTFDLTSFRQCEEVTVRLLGLESSTYQDALILARESTQRSSFSPRFNFRVCIDGLPSQALDSDDEETSSEELRL